MNEPPTPKPTLPAKNDGPRRIESVHIEGFRSLAEVTFRPNPGVTVLIGPNGAGKSNLVRFFDLVRAMLRERRLGLFVGLRGGADDQLFGGEERTPRLRASIRVTKGEVTGEYAFALEPAEQELFRFTEERFRDAGSNSGGPGPWSDLGSGHREANLVSVGRGAAARDDKPMARAIIEALEDTGAYHFPNTTKPSRFKKLQDVHDNFHLHPDGGNLAAVLLRIAREDEPRYEMICHCIGRVLPEFDGFDLRPESDKVYLYWKARGSAKRIGAHLTSDGSLRCFALATLLNHWPEALPSVLFLDEPELGLHPAAIPLLGGLIRSLGRSRQIVVATQSSLLVDEFEFEETQVLDLADGATRIRRLDPDDYRVWLEDHSLGQLWEMNLLGGAP